MENILNKDAHVLEQLKYDLNNANSDSDGGYEDDDSTEAALAIEENILKDEMIKNKRTEHFLPPIKSEKMDTDIILPEASLQILAKQNEIRKKEKSKKEMEEEEREKMQ